MTVWVSRQSWGEREEFCLTNSVACAGWKDAPNFRDFGSVDEIKAFFGDAGCSSPSQLGAQANSIWRFANEIEPGDWIALPSYRDPRRVHIGRVRRSYWYEADEPNPWLRHRVGVEWLARDQRRDALSASVQKSLQAQGYFYRMRAETAETEFERLTGGNNQPDRHADGV